MPEILEGIGLVTWVIAAFTSAFIAFVGLFDLLAGGGNFEMMSRGAKKFLIYGSLFILLMGLRKFPNFLDAGYVISSAGIMISILLAIVLGRRIFLIFSFQRKVEKHERSRETKRHIKTLERETFGE